MTSVNGPCSLDVAAQVDPILRRAIYWAASSGAADSRISRIAANSLSISTGAAFTETTRFVTTGVDLGFGGVLFGLSIGSPDGMLHRGISGGIECDDSASLGNYGTFMAARFGSFQMYADAAPSVVLYKSQDAYTDATGTNRTGADTRIAAGIGQWVVTVVNFAALAGATLTYVSNGGIATVLTEGVDWTAATSNSATATSLRAAMVAAGAMIASANVLGAGVIGAVGVNSTYALSITSSDAVNLTTAQATSNGTVRLGFANSGATLLSVSPTTITATVPINGTGGLFQYLGFNAGSINGGSLGYYAATAINLGGNITIGWAAGGNIGTDDLQIGRLGAASLRQGLAPSDTPVAQIFTLGENSLIGSGSNNIGGSDGTIRSGLGKGTGTASSLIFQTPTLAASGTGTQSYATRLTIATAALTATVPILLSNGNGFMAEPLVAGFVKVSDGVTDYKALTVSGLMANCGGTPPGAATGWPVAIGYYNAEIRLLSGVPILWANSTSNNGGVDVGLDRAAAGRVKVTDGSTGYGTIDIVNTDYAGASVGTLTNAPGAGNPARFLGIYANGTLYKIPAWT